MSDVAIRVSGLGKQYKIGARRPRADTLRDALTGSVHRLVSRLSPNGAAHDDTTIWALKDVSFEVKRGEVLGVIGRNGAGKSTLLKILSRITEPTTGEVDLHGRVGSLLEVGTGFHQELTGRENIYLNGAILGMKRREIQRKFDEIVDFSGVEQFIDTPVKHYSSGMYMRLAFGVAAHMETEILLVDEVLAVGDIAFQRKCIQEIGRAVNSGRTVVIVSHDLTMISNLCPWTMWLDYGMTRGLGKTQEIVGAYGQAAQRANVSASGMSAREDAQYGDKARIISIVVADDDGSPRRIFENGENLTLTVEVKGELPPAAYFEWALFNERDMLATSGGTFMSADSFRFPPKAQFIQARIGPLPLAQGTYSLTIRLGVLPGYILDEWRDAASIVISKCIPEGSGLPFDSRRGVVYVPSTYHVSEK